MAKIKLMRDFQEFLELLNSEKIEYLLIGGYAVAYYGHVRATKDMDLWIAVNPQNLQKLKSVLIKYGFSPESLPSPLFAGSKKMLRIGRVPLQLEILAEISGVEFTDAYKRRNEAILDGIKVNVIDLADLKANKKASGRLQDLADLETLNRMYPE